MPAWRRHVADIHHQQRVTRDVAEIPHQLQVRAAQVLVVQGLGEGLAPVDAVLGHGPGNHRQQGEHDIHDPHDVSPYDQKYGNWQMTVILSHAPPIFNPLDPRGPMR